MGTTNFVDKVTVIPTAWLNDADERIYEWGSYESLVTTKSLDADDNGKTFGLNLVGGFTVTLPTAAAAGAGWRCRLRVETAPTTAYIITEDTATDTNVLTGGFSCAELTDAAVAAYSAAFTQVNFVASLAVVGDWVKIECNGTRFYIEGHSNVQAGVTVT